MRMIKVAAAQLGPVQQAETRQAVVARMLALLQQAAAQGCDLIVYPELALTTFFPRWYHEDRGEADIWFEREMPSAGDPAALRGSQGRRHGDELRLCRADAGRPPLQHRRSSSTRPAGSSASTARSISPVMRNMIPSARISIWRSAISSPAIWAFPSGAWRAASSACASATTGAGRRPTASWVCKGSR